MNRTDRLFALVLHLRGDGWMQANTLARHFGVSVCTVYRDVLALNESGVPVISVPGKGYRLMDWYFLLLYGPACFARGLPSWPST